MSRLSIKERPSLQENQNLFFDTASILKLSYLIRGWDADYLE